MQAIITNYVGPRGVKGSRITATASAGRVVIDYDDALCSEANHAAAAKKLCAKFKNGKVTTLPAACPMAAPFGFALTSTITTRSKSEGAQ
jgi:hypothetical protein